MTYLSSLPTPTEGLSGLISSFGPFTMIDRVSCVGTETEISRCLVVGEGRGGTAGKRRGERKKRGR